MENFLTPASDRCCDWIFGRAFEGVKLPAELIGDLSLTTVERITAVMLHVFCQDPSNRTSLDLLAQKTGLSLRTAKNAVKKLIDGGYFVFGSRVAPQTWNIHYGDVMVSYIDRMEKGKTKHTKLPVSVLMGLDIDPTAKLVLFDILLHRQKPSMADRQIAKQGNTNVTLKAIGAELGISPSTVLKGRRVLDENELLNSVKAYYSTGTAYSCYHLGFGFLRIVNGYPLKKREPTMARNLEGEEDDDPARNAWKNSRDDSYEEALDKLLNNPDPKEDEIFGWNEVTEETDS